MISGMDPTSDSVDRRCQWCDARASVDAKQCPACGATLAQRETIGDLVIPGVTHVDPALEQYAAQPLRIKGNSPSQYVAGPAVGAAAAIGGPIGLAALGGLAAVAATEYLGAGRDGSGQPDPDKVGQPSEAVLQMVEKLEAEGEPPVSPPEANTEGSGEEPTQAT
jgi:RNA polymerase subunit RPABC4/transcription elongation factor Spt4